MKKLAATFLALTLCTSLAATALESDVVVFPDASPGVTTQSEYPVFMNEQGEFLPEPFPGEPLGTGDGYQSIMPLAMPAEYLRMPYAKKIVLNGQTLDASALPAANGIPMRLIAESDGGSASWYPEDSMSAFYLGSVSVSITFTTGIVQIGATPFSEPGTELINGVTYFSIDLINALPGYTAVEENGIITITTPSADPLVILAKDIIAQTDMGANMSSTIDQLATYYGFDPANYEAVAAFLPMMINADTVIIAKAAPGKLDAVKADLQRRLDETIASFEFYLPGPYAMAQAGKVVSTDDYAMLIISSDTELAINLFNAALGA